MALVLPTDNAVIDYSIINQIIAAVNQHQGVINQIQQNNTATAAGTPVIYKTIGAVLKPDSGGATGNKFTLKLPITGINTFTSITATPYISSAAKPAYCWISSQNSSQIVFSTNIAVSSIHYIAFGTT